jgi:isopenicillin N synthase-like dioxygenase
MFRVLLSILLMTNSLVHAKPKPIETLELDVVSYEQLIAGDKEVFKTIKKALYEKGIVGVRGVPGYKEKYTQFLRAARAFNALPEEIKERYKPNQELGETFLGYEIGKEKFQRPNGEWVVDDLKASYYAYIPDSIQNKWPREVRLQHAFENLGEIMVKVGAFIMYNTLGLLGERTGFNLQPSMGRMLYYRKSENNENPYWCGAHFDHALFTALLPAIYFRNDRTIREPREAGLFVRTSEKEPFKKIIAEKDVMMFQVGEFAQLVTNDEIRATEHRVHKPLLPTERYTLAVFFDAPMDTPVHSSSVLTKDARYKTNETGMCTYRQWHEASFKRYIVEENLAEEKNA